MKIKILKSFLENKELVQAMKNCDHGYCNNPNPYHLEGDVWTHTMLVYNNAYTYDFGSLIMALCHDIGKVISRKENNEKQKTSFYGHAEKSIQPTIDFICKLKKEKILTDRNVKSFIKYCLPMMSNHMLYYQNRHKKDYFIYNDDKDITFQLEYYLDDITRCDSDGSICKFPSRGEECSYKEEFIPKPFNPDLPTINIWVGLPYSGKDYLAEKTGYPIISYDQIRIKLYKENHLNWKNESNLYNKAWLYCRDKDLNRYLLKELRDINARIMNICNTSLTRKARRSLINCINPKKYNINIKHVFCPTEVLFKRIKYRPEQIIPSNIINDMMGRMTIATHFEKNINDIDYIFND